MIIRKQEDAFLMIQQHEHGKLSRELFRHWKHMPAFSQHHDSVSFAIANHDIGWLPLDRKPLWNNEANAPYSFLDYPLEPKLTAYQQGIEMVEAEDSYAALLCSQHYTRFVAHHESDIAKDFIAAEAMRRQRIMDSLGDVEQEEIAKDYALLQLFDDFSLLLCMNEPGNPVEKFHPFFRKGIRVPQEIEGVHVDYIQPRWDEPSRITFVPFPFEEAFSLAIPFKTVKEQSITENGLVNAYQQAKDEILTIQIYPA